MMWREVIYLLSMAAHVAGVGCAAVLLATSVTAARRCLPGDRAGRFESGWKGAFGLILWMMCCTGLSIGLSDFVLLSSWTDIATVLLNLSAQPLWLLLCWACIRKSFLGLNGRVAYAWRECTLEELAGVSTTERSRITRFCIFQGMLLLPVCF